MKIIPPPSNFVLCLPKNRKVKPIINKITDVNIKTIPISSTILLLFFFIINFKYEDRI
ncbi:MAG: hypothetical protein QXI09_01595 [Candidatus Aenigmatarchaeota archaeon]